MSSLRDKTINLAAGPSPIPTSVLERSASALLDYNQSGMGILEISHRGSDFTQIMKSLDQQFRDLLNIPSNYQVLWMQGGGTGQFAAVVVNLLAWFRIKHEGKVEPVLDYLITGSWSKKAAEEARMMGAKVNVVCDGSLNKFASIPEKTTWKFSESTETSKPAFTYFCDNETVDGLEFENFPFEVLDPQVPLVADMSSNILSRKVDVSKYGLIYAGAQKNMGPAGVTVVIIRKDLIGQSSYLNLNLNLY
jgi:phosphoserine aminotransferase